MLKTKKKLNNLGEKIVCNASTPNFVIDEEKHCVL